MVLNPAVSAASSLCRTNRKKMAPAATAARAGAAHNLAFIAGPRNGYYSVSRGFSRKPVVGQFEVSSRGRVDFGSTATWQIDHIFHGPHARRDGSSRR